MPLATGKESLEAYRHGVGGQLRIDGGLAVPFGGVEFEKLPQVLSPAVLTYPLTQFDRRFMDIAVELGQEVHVGQQLARSPDHCAGLAILACGNGRVVEVSPSKRRAKGFIRVETTSGASVRSGDIVDKKSPVSELRSCAVERGIWVEIQSGMEMLPPPLHGNPKVVVVRCVFAEPHLEQGSKVIEENMEAFLDGLEILYHMAGGDAAIELTLAEHECELAQSIRESLRGRVFVHTVNVPVKYPVENPLLLATLLGREHGWGPDAFWMLDPQVVLALSRSFASGLHWSTRLVAVAGSGVARPMLVEAPLGTPLREVVAGCLGPVPIEKCCLLRGGLYHGVRGDADDGLAYGDRAVTVVPEVEQSELFGWLRGGSDRHSWAKVFSSAFRPCGPFQSKTLLRSDVRPCINCGFCHDACPVGLYPHHLHRLVTHDELEEAESMGLLNCVECHCCSYGCVSKLELSRDIVAARRKVLREEGEVV